MRRTLGLVALASLAACTGGGERPVTSTARAPMSGNLDRVLGRDANALRALFGDPDQDMRAMAGRRLQFAGPLCVLDAYLYRGGSAEPVVTWIDTRTPAGADIDRASCIAALTRRKAAR